MMQVFGRKNGSATFDGRTDRWVW